MGYQRGDGEFLIFKYCCYVSIKINHWATIYINSFLGWSGLFQTQTRRDRHVEKCLIRRRNRVSQKNRELSTIYIKEGYLIEIQRNYSLDLDMGQLI